MTQVRAWTTFLALILPFWAFLGLREASKEVIKPEEKLVQSHPRLFSYSC